METIDLNTIRPAEYNPRRLSTDALDTLKDSITSCGVLKPILVNGDNRVIIAGHQRTRAMREMGYTSAPGFVLHGLKNDDEVRFNQLHNQIECEFSEDAPQLHIKRKLEGGGARGNSAGRGRGRALRQHVNLCHGDWAHD